MTTQGYFQFGTNIGPVAGQIVSNLNQVIAAMQRAQGMSATRGSLFGTTLQEASVELRRLQGQFQGTIAEFERMQSRLAAGQARLRARGGLGGFQEQFAQPLQQFDRMQSRMDGAWQAQRRAVAGLQDFQRQFSGSLQQFDRLATRIPALAQMGRLQQRFGAGMAQAGAMQRMPITLQGLPQRFGPAMAQASAMQQMPMAMRGFPQRFGPGMAQAAAMQRTLDPLARQAEESLGRRGHLGRATSEFRSSMGQLNPAIREHSTEQTRAAQALRRQALARAQFGLGPPRRAGGGGFGGGGFAQFGPGEEGMFGREGLMAHGARYARYTVVAAGIFALGSAISDTKQEAIDYAESLTDLEIAVGRQAEVSSQWQNELQEVARIAGANVAQAMDTAARGVRAFSDSFGAPQEEMQEIGNEIASAAERLAIITGADITSATGDIIAIGTSFGLAADEAERINEAIASAKDLGGVPAEISQGLSNAALAFSEAGFTVEEAASLMSVTTARLDASGQATATRLARVFQTARGAPAQAALVGAGADPGANVATQLQQLAELREQGELTGKQFESISNVVAGTFASREFLAMIRDMDEAMANVERNMREGGRATEEFERRLNNLAGIIRRIRGSLTGIQTGLVRSGAFAHIGTLLQLVEPGLRLVNNLLQGFNRLPGAIRTATMMLLQYTAAMRVLQRFDAARIIGAGALQTPLRGERLLGAGFAERRRQRAIARAVPQMQERGITYTTGAPGAGGMERWHGTRQETTAVTQNAAAHERRAGAIRRAQVATRTRIQTTRASVAALRSEEGWLTRSTAANARRAAGPAVMRAGRGVANIAQSPLGQAVGVMAIIAAGTALYDSFRRAAEAAEIAEEAFADIGDVAAEGGAAPQDMLDFVRSLNNAAAEMENAEEGFISGIRRGMERQGAVEDPTAMESLGAQIGETLNQTLFGGQAPWQELEALPGHIEWVGDRLEPIVGALDTAAGALRDLVDRLPGLPDVGQPEEGGWLETALDWAKGVILPWEEMPWTPLDLLPGGEGAGGGQREPAEIRDFAAQLERNAERVNEAIASTAGDRGVLIKSAEDMEAMLQQLEYAGAGAQAEIDAIVEGLRHLQGGPDFMPDWVPEMGEIPEGLASKFIEDVTFGFFEDMQQTLDAIDANALRRRELDMDAHPAADAWRDILEGLVDPEEAQEVYTAIRAEVASALEEWDLTEGGELSARQARILAERITEQVDDIADLPEAMRERVMRLMQERIRDVAAIDWEPLSPEDMAEVRQALLQRAEIVERQTVLMTGDTVAGAEARLAAANAAVTADILNDNEVSLLSQLAKQESEKNLADAHLQRAEARIRYRQALRAEEDLAGRAMDDLAIANERLAAALETGTVEEQWEARGEIAGLQRRWAQERREQAAAAARAEVDPRDEVGRTAVDLQAAERALGETEQYDVMGAVTRAWWEAYEEVQRLKLQLSRDEMQRAQAQRRAEIDPRDDLANAAASLEDAREALDLETPGTTAYAQRQRELDEARIEDADTQRRQAQARRQASVFPGANLASAWIDLVNAREELAATHRGSDQYWDNVAELQRAQVDYATAQVDRARQRRLASEQFDITDPVEMARIELRAAMDRLGALERLGAPDEMLDEARHEVRQAQNRSEREAFEQRFRDAQTANELGRMSHAAYINYLEDEAERLRSIQDRTRQQQDMLDQVDRAIKSAQDQMEAQWNIGDIRIPTPFEVRRAVEAQSQGLVPGDFTRPQTVANVTNNRVQINGADLVQVKRLLHDLLGSQASGRVAAGSNGRKV